MKRIDTSEWKPFSLGGKDGLFNIVKGRRLTKADMREGEINFIGASAMDNGITAKIANNAHIHPANTITVSYNGSVGEAFYQTAPFWASDDINILYPRFKLNRHIALFLIPLIRVVGKNYAFVDKWTKEQMEASKIILPVTSDGKPDFDYMESFMVRQEKRVKASVNALVSMGGGQ